MLYAPLHVVLLATVLVSAHSSAEWIPVVSDTSDSDQRPLADGKGKLRGLDEAMEKSNEERAGSPPRLDPEFLGPLMRKGETSADPLAPILGSSLPSLIQGKSILSSNVPTKDLLAFTERMEQLDINVDAVAAAVQTLPPTGRRSYYDKDSLTLMALGNEYFKKVERFGFEMKSIPPDLLQRLLGEYVQSDNFKRWLAGHKDPRVPVRNVYGKMHWLENMGDFKMCDKEDLAEMAFGSEYFAAHNIKLTLPSPIQGGDKIETRDQLKHQIEQLANRHDVDVKVRAKLRALSENPDSIGKTREELLRSAKDEVLDDELDRLKSNKAFAQRMEKLKIDIENVKVAVQSLRNRPGLLKYDDYSLYLMALGSEYFQHSRAEIESIQKNQFISDMGTYVSSGDFKRWADEHTHYFGKVASKFYGKMRCLKRDEHLKSLTGDELANMAFGSEFFSAYKIKLNIPSPIQGGVKIETRDQLKHQIEQLTKRHDVDVKVIAKLRALAENPDSIGKTNEELLRRAKDEVLDDKLDRLKSNKAFTERMAKVGINVDGAKADVQRFGKQLWFLKYDEYSLYLMALGSEYFKNLENSGTKLKSFGKTDFKRAMSTYASSEDFQRWSEQRKYALDGILGKFYRKICWLKHDKQLKLLEGDELANMAFGSELFKSSDIKLTFSSPIQDGDTINRLINQLPKGGHGQPDAKQKLKEVLKEDGEKIIGQTSNELKRKAIHDVIGDLLEEETKKSKVAELKK